MARSFLPSSDAQLLAWSANFTALTGESASDYGLTTAQATAYASRHTVFAAAFQTAFDPMTRTRPSIAAKGITKGLLATMARDLVRIIQASPGLSDTDRRALKITVAKQRAPVPAPTARPALELAGVSGRVVTVNVYDSSTATKRGKPVNCVGAKLYTFVGASYPSDPTTWAYQGDFTKTRCEIDFPDTTPAGQQVWVTAVWYTRRGDTGPIAVPLSTNLQGGGVGETGAMKIAA